MAITISEKIRIRRYRKWAESFLRNLNDYLALKGNLRKNTLRATVCFYSILLNAKNGPEPPGKRRKR